jgi:ankyrin repeat protein
MVSEERKGSAPQDNNDEEYMNVERKLLEETAACITRLFKVTSLIRRAASPDLFTKALSWSQYRFDDQIDIARVGEKYPKLVTEQLVWLQKKLGRAITHRRHYLSYIQNHREQLAGSLHQEDENQTQASDPQNSANKQLHNEKSLLDSSSRPSSLLIKASSLAPTRLPFQTVTMERESYIEHDTKPCTAVASTPDADFEPSGMTRVPKLDELSTRGEKEEIQCPFCFQVKRFKEEREWRRHVFADLQSYLCTFPECDTPYFRDIDEWWQHEMENHRVNYTCRLCEGKSFHLKGQYLAHVKQQHPGVFDDSDERYVIEISRKPVKRIPAQDCPCCFDWTDRLRGHASVLDDSAPTEDALMVSPTNFKCHVGSHLEQLALLAIPISSSTEDKVDINVTVEADERTLSPVGHEQALEPNHTEPLDEFITFGHLYADQGRLDRAEHPDTLNSMVNLASTIREQRQPQEAEELFQERADVNAAALGLKGRTSLQAAAKEGRLADIEYLLQGKIDVNRAARYNGRTALQAAAEGGHLAVVEQLLQAKADVNAAAARTKGRTALQAAAEGGHLAVVERLLQAKADVNAAAAMTMGKTALEAAAEGGHLAVVKRLLQEKTNRSAVAAAYARGTALQAAAQKGHLAVVELLLQEKATVDTAIAGTEGRTELHAAAEGKHVELVELLLQRTVDENVASAEDDGRTAALQAAAEGGHLAVVERLLQEKTNGNTATVAFARRTALQAAAQKGHLAVVERLLQEKAVVNAAVVERAGRNETGHLLERDSDCHGSDSSTQEILVDAAKNSNYGKELIELVLDRRGAEVKITEQVVKAAAENNTSGKEIMVLLLDRRGDEVKITEQVVKAAAGNKKSGKEIMALLLDRREDEVKITEQVVKAAVENTTSGKEVMVLLLDQRATRAQLQRLLLSGVGVSEQLTPTLFRIRSRGPWIYLRF